MTRKQAEARVVRAAMKWYRKFDPELDYTDSPLLWDEDRALMKACAAALARKEKK